MWYIQILLSWSFLGSIERVFVGVFFYIFFKDVVCVGHGFGEISPTSRMRVEEFHV